MRFLSRTLVVAGVVVLCLTISAAAQYYQYYREAGATRPPVDDRMQKAGDLPAFFYTRHQIEVL